jgi:dienelactone hydrolase
MPAKSVASQIYIAKSKAPLLINTCELDEMFPPPMIETADKKFAGFAPGYRRVHFEGVHHGFATRGDLVRPP